jgi:archaellum component FlaC
MRKVRSYAPLILCAAAALAGCGNMNNVNWDWWKKPKEPAKNSSQSSAQDPNLTIKPAEALRLRDENKTLHDQLQELQVRDQQLADQLKQTTVLYEGQLKVIDALKDAPGERDNYKKQVDELKAEIARLRQEISRLKTGEVPPAGQPNLLPPAQTLPAQVVPLPAAPPPLPPAVIPPVQVVPATPNSSSAPGFD